MTSLWSKKEIKQTRGVAQEAQEVTNAMEEARVLERVKARNDAHIQRLERLEVDAEEADARAKEAKYIQLSMLAKPKISKNQMCVDVYQQEAPGKVGESHF